MYPQAGIRIPPAEGLHDVEICLYREAAAVAPVSPRAACALVRALLEAYLKRHLADAGHPVGDKRLVEIIDSAVSNLELSQTLKNGLTAIRDEGTRPSTIPTDSRMMLALETYRGYSKQLTTSSMICMSNRRRGLTSLSADRRRRRCRRKPIQTHSALGASPEPVQPGAEFSVECGANGTEPRRSKVSSHPGWLSSSSWQLTAISEIPHSGVV